ncbi:MAG TPA: Ig-like domain-containing protein [Candidatus Binatia bacterium]|nr:Ig-like domain-containing protein [Candidatus Binatia bacterium]
MPTRAVHVAAALLTLCLAADLHAPRASRAAAAGGFLGGDPGPAPEGIPYSEDDFIEGAPKVTGVRLARFAGPEGRLRLEVTVEYPHLRDEWDGLVSDKATYQGRVNVQLGSCGKGTGADGASGRVRVVDTHALPMDTDGPRVPYTHVIQLTAEESQRLLSSAPCAETTSAAGVRGAASAASIAGGSRVSVGSGPRLPVLRSSHGKVLIDVSATASFDQFGDGESEETARVRYQRRVLIGVVPPRATTPFLCTSKADLQPQRFPLTGLRYAWAPTQHLRAWMNEPYDVRICATDAKELPTSPQLEVFSDPDHGTATNLRIENGYLKVTYTPAPGYFGDDSFGYYNFPTPTQWDQLTVNMRVKPFAMGAIGDSITAGWGYLGSGAAPQLSGNDNDFDIVILKLCEPLESLNNRCSSNSDLGPDDKRNLWRWTADGGLANNVAWPAQFANRHGVKRTTNGFTTFDNRAVSGSQPQDWVPGGVLYPHLESMLQNNLTVLTLGANPMLANTLLDTKLGDECGRRPNNMTPEQEVAAGVKCMQGQMQSLKLYERLRGVYRRLLDGPRNHVVVMLYGLTYPVIGDLVTSFLANSYSSWTIEAMANEVTREIKRAVEDEAQLAREQGKGDRLFWASPGRFNMGLPGYDQAILKLPGIDCPTSNSPLIGKVDGTSNQSAVVQKTLAFTSQNLQTQLTNCPSRGASENYFEGLDGGLHLSRAGHKRFADALDAKVKELNLPLPRP